MDPVALYPAASAQLVMSKRMEAISNNIANVSTTGFKKNFPVFGAVIAKMAKANSMGGAEDGTGGVSVLPMPTFAVLDELVTNFSSGTIRVTGEPLDIAIDGKGFFQIQTAGGVRYSRNGAFTISSEGKIVTKDGFPLLGIGGPMELPQGLVYIDETGKVSVQTAAGGPATEVDTIALVDIPKTHKLQKVGDSMFALLDGEATVFEEGKAHLKQGALETSNVNPAEEMIALIITIRHYEEAQRAIQTVDDVTTRNVSRVGQLQA